MKNLTLPIAAFGISSISGFLAHITPILAFIGAILGIAASTLTILEKTKKKRPR